MVKLRFLVVGLVLGLLVSAAYAQETTELADEESSEVTEESLEETAAADADNSEDATNEEESDGDDDGGDSVDPDSDQGPEGEEESGESGDDADVGTSDEYQGETSDTSDGTEGVASSDDSEYSVPDDEFSRDTSAEDSEEVTDSGDSDEEPTPDKNPLTEYSGDLDSSGNPVDKDSTGGEAEEDKSSDTTSYEGGSDGESDEDGSELDDTTGPSDNDSSVVRDDDSDNAADDDKVSSDEEHQLPESEADDSQSAEASSSGSTEDEEGGGSKEFTTEPGSQEEGSEGEGNADGASTTSIPATGSTGSEASTGPTQVYQGLPQIPGATSTSHEYQGVEYAGTEGDSPEVEDGFDLRSRCVSWGRPVSIETFDGVGYSFQGLGAFTLFASDQDVERVDSLVFRDPERRISHNVGVAFRSNGDVFSVRLVETATKKGATVRPEILFNNKDVSYSVLRRRQTSIGPFSVLREGAFRSDERLIVSIKSDNGTSVVASFEHRNTRTHLNLFVEVPPAYFLNTHGLCGVFDINALNDMTTPSGSVEADPAALGSSWAVRDAKLSLFTPYTPYRVPVLSGDVTPALLNATSTDVEGAKKMCSRSSKDFLTACVMNTLVGGADSALESVRVDRVAHDGQVYASEAVHACLKNEYTIGPWSLYGDCSAKCGFGTKTRSRLVAVVKDFVREVCGNLTQQTTCEADCPKPPVWARCVSFGTGHMITFDNAAYSYEGVGEYMMYRSRDRKEQVNVVLDRPSSSPFQHVSWTLGAAVRFGSDVLSVHMVRPEYERLMIRYNGRPLGSLKGLTKVGLMTLQQSGEISSSGGNHSYILEAKIPGGTTVTFSLNGYGRVTHLNVFVEVPGRELQETDGTCGSFDFNPDNDYVDSAGKLQKNARKMAYSYRVEPAFTLFTDPVPKSSPPKFFLTPAPAHLAKTRQQLSVAIEACNGVDEEYRAMCQLDVVAGGRDAVNTILDVQEVMKDNKLEPETASIPCLLLPGTTLGPWSNWSDCSLSCGDGSVKERSRAVIAHTGVECGRIGDSKPCQLDPCPVPCQVSAWSAWSNCSVACGTGVMYRNRTVAAPALHGGAECPHLNETKTCRKKACCRASEWSKWTDCNNGMKMRSRVISAAHCGETVQRSPCCFQGNWTTWSSCKDGVQTRTRIVVGHDSCVTANKTKSEGSDSTKPKCCGDAHEKRQCAKSTGTSDSCKCHDSSSVSDRCQKVCNSASASAASTAESDEVELNSGSEGDAQTSGSASSGSEPADGGGDDAEMENMEDSML